MKKILAMLLAFTLGFCVLAGCGSSETGSSEEESESTVDYSSLDLDAEDMCYAFSGIPGDTVLFTVDGYDVTASMYFYWLAYDISYYGYYLSYYGEDELDLSEGSEDAEMLKDDAKEMAAQYVLATEKAKDMGLEMTDEMIDEMNTDIEEVKNSYGGEEAFQESIRKMGLTEADYDYITAATYYVEMLEDEEYEGHPTTEEIEQYAEDNDLMYMKHILIMTVDPDTYEPLTDEALAEKDALAQDILNQIRESDDPIATFDELMNEYSEDTGLETYPDGYLFTEGDMVEPVEDAVRELEFNEISDLVEYDGTDDGYYSGYHIILRLDPAESEDIVGYWLDDQLNDMILDWLDNATYEYSDEWNEIDIEKFYDTYCDYQTAFQEKEAAESEEEDLETAKEAEGIEDTDNTENTEETETSEIVETEVEVVS